MRRLTGLAIRITASVLLFLTISAWAVSRFQYVAITVEWIRLDVQAAGVVVFIADWGEMNVHVHARADDATDDSFDAPRLFLRLVSGEFTVWFPGGWFSIIRNLDILFVIKHAALVCYTGILNIVVYGLWWRRKRKAGQCED